MKRRILIFNLLMMVTAASLGISAGAQEKLSSQQEESADEATAETSDETDGVDSDAADGKDTEEEKSAKDGLFGEFETITLYGEEVDQDIFTEADLNMVNIWGTFCGPCIQEMPDLAELSEEYEEKGLRIIGIISDVMTAEHEAAVTIVEKTGADYTHLLLSEDLLDSYLWEIQVVPTTVFLDGEGKQVGEVYTGSRSKEAWSEIIDEMLEQVDKKK